MPEMVDRQIEAMILDGRLKAGERLPAERSLCDSLNVSRNTLREALKELRARGVIETRRGSGTFVASFQELQPDIQALHPDTPLRKLLHNHAETLAGLMEVRRLLEGEAAYQAARRATAEDLEELQQAYEALVDEYPKSNSSQAHAERDLRFHRAFYVAAHNPILLLALCLTVDTPLAGNRERDLYNGMTMPPKITPKSFFSYGTSFEWLFNLMLSPDFKLANVIHRVDALGKGVMGLMDYVNSQFDRTVTWDDAAWLAEQWDGPFVIKGLQSPEDAKRAVEIGASALMVSNHGGRQLEGAPAPVDCIAPIRDAIGDQLELIVDGGIRRGTHIIKALAQGANACSIGRPYLYGLASGGQKGVERALTLLTAELERSMALLGVNNIADIRSEHVVRRG